MSRKPRASGKQPRGQALVTMALSLVVVLGFVGLAVDVGLMMLARNELQNAADAAALAGAQAMYKDNTGTFDPAPGWTRATDSSTNAVTYNKALHVSLVQSTVTTGYWNIGGTPAGMQPKTKSPLVANDAAAIRVQIKKAPGSNGGPIALFLAPMVGVNAEAIQASAVAVVSYPGTIAPNTTFPTAINNCMYDVFWDRATNRPKIDPDTGLPFVFRIGSSYHYGTCESGQWTSMFTGNNDVPTIRDLIDNGNPESVTLGDQIWIEPGTKASLYGYIPIPSTALLPVVEDVSTSTHALATVIGFGPFTITAARGGGPPGEQFYIEGHFEDGYDVPLASGGGPYYGSLIPPTLVQ